MRYIVLSVLGVSAFLLSMTTSANAQPKTIRYLPIGDSYTIGEGIDAKENFPSLLVSHLRQTGVDIDLIGNPAQTGWTTQDAIDKELPLFKELKPDFSTLLVGVNDWVQGVSELTFQKNLSFLVDEMLKTLSNNHLIIVTIPDFSATPNGGQYAKGRNITEGLSHFNDIIITEAKKRNLLLVDIFKLSQEMKSDSSLVAPDGLHPSGKEYEKWEALIYPEALKIFKKQ